MYIYIPHICGVKCPFSNEIMIIIEVLFYLMCVFNKIRECVPHGIAPNYLMS